MSTAEAQGSATVIPANQGVKVEASVTVHKPVHDVYQEWRNLEHLPQFMSHLKEVRPEGEYRSHWVAEGPMGMSVEWDAEITNDNRDEAIAWQSVDGSEIDTAGSVHFRPIENGETEVRVNLKFNPPGGRLGAAFAKILGNDPEAQIREDLQRFKHLMETETGETMENERGRSPRSENL